MVNREKDIVDLLRSKGWICKKDEVGDWYCILDLGDRNIQVIPSFKKTGDTSSLALLESVSTEQFTNLENRVFEHGEQSDHSPFIRPWNSKYTKKGEAITCDDVLELIDGIAEWAKNQDIEAAVAEYSKKCPDSPGQKQLYHLVALIMTKDVGTLKNYEDYFKSGNTLNFVPMITYDVIKRAVELAKYTNNDQNIRAKK